MKTITDTFVLVAPDCSVTAAEVPVAHGPTPPVHVIQYELLTARPYQLTLEDLIFEDDEEPVRKTFREWLEGANLGCHILAAGDADAALVQANQHTIGAARRSRLPAATRIG